MVDARKELLRSWEDVRKGRGILRLFSDEEITGYVTGATYLSSKKLSGLGLDVIYLEVQKLVKEGKI